MSLFGYINDQIPVSAIKYLIWLKLNFLGYWFARRCFQPIYIGTNVPKNSWWRKIFVVQDDSTSKKSYLQIQCEHYTGTSLGILYQNILFWSSIMFYYGNMAEKMSHLTDLLWIGNMFSFVLLYGLLGQVHGMNYSVTPSSIPNWSPQFTVWFYFTTSLFLAMLPYQLYLAYTLGEALAYLSGVVLVPSIYYYWYKRIPLESWHIHHYFIGFYCSLCLRYNTWLTKFIWSFYYAVFIEGGANGYSPVIYTGGDPGNELKSPN